MKRITFFLLIIGCSSSDILWGQNINVDSLINRTMDDRSTPTDLIQAHNRLTRYFQRNDTTKANFHLFKLDSIAHAENDSTSIFLAGDLKMRRYLNNGQFQEGEKEARNQIRMAKLLKRDDFINGSYNALGVVFGIQYKNDSSLYYFEKANQLILEKEGTRPEAILNSLINLGATALKASQVEKSLNYYLEGLVISEDVNDLKGLSMCHSGLGIVYFHLENLKKSRFHHKRAIFFSESYNNQLGIGDALLNLGNTFKEEKPDSAIHYYRKAVMVFKSLDIKERIGVSALATGDALKNKNQLKEALKYFEEARESFLVMNIKRRLIDSENRMASIHFELGNFKKARSYMDDVITYYDNRAELESSAKAHLLLAKIAEQIGDLPLALSSQRKHQEFNKQLDSLMFNKDVAEITTKFETEAKEAKIEKQKIIITQKEQQNKYLLISSILGGLLFFSGFLIFFQRSKKNKALAAEKINRLEKEKKILSMNAMIEGQEAERSRIAKDLHDGLGGLLSTVKAHFSNIQSEIQKIEKIDVYNRANELVDEACDEVRRISHNLMPGALRLEGLITAVRHLGEEMTEAHPFTVRVESIGMTTRMEESKEVFIYRIIQEALNNIIKHADASDVLIQLSETEEEFHFIIEDDGKGFDPAQIETGLGLKSIRSRVDFLKGALDIDTKKGVGTTLSWHMPK